MIHLPRILEAAVEIQCFCNEREWRFCFIGGVAVQRWGEPRLTQDVDLTLLTGFGNEELFVEALLASFEGRRPDTREFALQHRVVLLRTRSRVDADVALGALPFEERTIERSSDWPWTTGQLLRTCSAEDLIVHKAFAGRDLDWGDIERVLVRQHGKLDLDLIRTELAPLVELKGDLEAQEKLEQKIAMVRRRLQTKR